jgi:bacteriorhodopsin
MKDIIKLSLYVSLFVQIVTLLFDGYALTQTVSSSVEVIKTLLKIETLVQLIELTFYSWYTFNFHSVAEATFYRYYDWMFTTPLMLFTTTVFYDYQSKTDEEKKTMSIQQFLQENWKSLLIIGVFNFMMLFYGYLYERNIIDLTTSTVLGFAGFAGSFYVMYDKFASKTPKNIPLYLFMFIVWGLYGIAAMFTPAWKNISYNILDIIAKNFYGVFLGYLVLSNKQ